MNYNIVQRINISIITVPFFMLAQRGLAQVVNDKQLVIVKSVEAYNGSVKGDSNQRMVNLRDLIPSIALELRYGTTNNFVHRIMYSERPNYTFMRLPAAKALAQVENDLGKKGLALKIFDAYRPYFVTKEFWDLVHDDRYVADPRKGSGHNRGIAVDLTIINLKTGMELDMPTGFDNFTDSAHHDFNALPGEVLANRKLLKETMEKFGFVEFPTEWWHYSLPDPERFAVLDLSFGDLEKQANR
ncbi:MAG TPA: M15 family metallopeptidase [Puia sp.]|nr:M15 family metallopeptidase [Puia sp.]